MKRRDFLKATSGGVALSAIAAPAISQSAPELKWRLASSFPKSLDALHSTAEFICKRVAEITDNKFQIQLFAAGEIVPGLQVLDATTNGTVEMSWTAAYYNWGKDPAFAFATAVPFGLNARQCEAWHIHGGGSELLNELFAKFNVYGIPTGNTGGQMGGWFRNEIKTVADMNGLKFRIGGFAGKVISKLGVVPQQIAAGDIYPALEKGALDAVEWIGPYDDERLGFVKVAKYYYYPGWWEGGANGHILINLAKWNELTAGYKAALYAACREAGTWMTAKYDYVNPPALKRLLANGAELRAFSPEIMDAAYKATNEVCTETAATNPLFKKMYDSYTAFRRDAYQWWQVTELTFDVFQVRQSNRT